MKTAILGAGAIGLSYAALLESRGHDVTLLSPSGTSTRDLAAGAALTATGQVAGAFRPRIATDMADALDGADAAIVTVPSNGARAVLDALAPCLSPGQAVILSSQASLAALYLSKALAARGVGVPIAAWSTTAAMGRRLSPTAVDVDTVRPSIDRVILHESAAGDGARVCDALFGAVFRDLPDLLAITLSNLNPPIHLANSLANFTRMEKGEDWDNYAGSPIPWAA
jgi:opine dehydrogenase